MTQSVPKGVKMTAHHVNDHTVEPHIMDTPKLRTFKTPDHVSFAP